MFRVLVSLGGLEGYPWGTLGIVQMRAHEDLTHPRIPPLGSSPVGSDQALFCLSQAVTVPRAVRLPFTSPKGETLEGLKREARVGQRVAELGMQFSEWAFGTYNGLLRMSRHL